MEKILTDNELIAEFMQDKKALAVYRHPKYLPSDDQQYVKYNTSWDWLMPVVEKINKINMLDFDIDRNEQWLHEKVVTTRVNCELTYLYRAVVEFIKWYNSKN